MLYRPLSTLLGAGLLLAAACSSPSAETTTKCADIPAKFTVQHPEWARNASIYEVNIRQYTPRALSRRLRPSCPTCRKWAWAFCG
ncbi:hypothetical protein [Hymenobacter cellulosilyticus]|uniref:Uncharacterized protein n=1 Tax=Hymenobacter cellulosilyticus TaxID=2932248 RepID=A0A8T9Q8U0_9BACT|nr:hypothetical protein [Hymenobacter cellulosilyticus]UOQ71949.1 hypothetical protein MUN79_25700 [Hymenobacter cellulosilyticus]